MPAHEQIAVDLASDASCRYKLSELVRNDTLPPVYKRHPVVLANPGELVCPVALYIDAVPYSQTDSVIGWWLVNLVSGRRYLFALLRKSEACKCGCRHWCSLHPYFQVARWSLRALAAGQFPSVDHTGRDFGCRSMAGAANAGKRMEMKCACLFIKGDWAEFSTTLGLPMWQDSVRPCFVCNGTGYLLFVSSGNTMENLRWKEHEVGDYAAACARCLLDVHVADQADIEAIAARLRYDKRQHGSHGRAMQVSYPALQLRQGDRLEPCDGLVDIAFLERLPPPCTIQFWRCSEESHTRHCNPLFDSDIGLDPVYCLAIDSLHAMKLGVMKVWCRMATWNVLESGVFGDVGTAEEKLATAVMAFRASLMSWYSRRHVLYPHEVLTRVSDFTAKMCGTRNSPKLATKGAETHALLLFLIDTYTLYQHRLGLEWQRILQAGEALQRIVNIWHRHRWTIPEAEHKDLASIIIIIIYIYIYGNIILCC